MENRETFGTAVVSRNTLSITGITAQQHFSNALTAGQRIFLSNGSCPNRLCTLGAAPSGPDAATLFESPGNGTTFFRAYGWGIRVWKDNAERVRFGRPDVQACSGHTHSASNRSAISAVRFR